MAAIIPFDGYPNTTFTINLAGQVVRIYLKYYVPFDKWYISVRSIEGESYIESAQLVNNGLVFGDFKVPEFQGDIKCVPTAQEFGEPGRDSFGTTHNLIFLTEAEL